METKFLVVGDLHGSKPNIYFKDFDAIIAPGDFCSSDKIGPLVFEGMRKRFEEKSEYNKWFDIVGKERARELVEESLSKGRKVLEFLNHFGVPVYIVPGNWEWTGKQNKELGWDFLRRDRYRDLIKGLPNIVDVHHKLIDIGNYQIIGHGISSGPEYPQYKEDLESAGKEELEKMRNDYEKDSKKLESLFEKATKPVIFISHDVPFNTPLDEITNKSSPRYGYHYGSLIAREMIEKYQPLVCIGGHIHEHFGKFEIGRTMTINAGFGPYVNVFMELSDSHIKRLDLYRGKKDELRIQ